jgi:hypothetical protein
LKIKKENLRITCEINLKCINGYFFKSKGLKTKGALQAVNWLWQSNLEYNEDNLKYSQIKSKQ